MAISMRFCVLVKAVKSHEALHESIVLIDNDMVDGQSLREMDILKESIEDNLKLRFGSETVILVEKFC